mmetsp:Transcript_2789/g.5113  ORF Transcript_2789/g.5113 Transcript_2789/m.5113 type:complete len:82 (+) Transcript_2789:322-567(+)
MKLSPAVRFLFQGPSLDVDQSPHPHDAPQFREAAYPSALRAEVVHDGDANGSVAARAAQWEVDAVGDSDGGMSAGGSLFRG